MDALAALIAEDDAAHGDAGTFADSEARLVLRRRLWAALRTAESRRRFVDSLAHGPTVDAAHAAQEGA